MQNAGKQVDLSNSSRFNMVIIIYLKVVSADTHNFTAHAVGNKTFACFILFGSPYICNNQHFCQTRHQKRSLHSSQCFGTGESCQIVNFLFVKKISVARSLIVHSSKKQSCQVCQGARNIVQVDPRTAPPDYLTLCERRSVPVE